MKMKINVWQILTTVIGIVLAFWIVEEIKFYRQRKGIKQVNTGGGVSIGANIGVGDESLLDGEVNVGTGGDRTVVYN